jgi:hypothetical protein
MNKSITTIAVILIAGLFTQYATAESIPNWIKNNAGWWAEGAISQEDFVSGLQFLIQNGILRVPPTQVSGEKSDDVPAWVKNNAEWWAKGEISDDDFVGGIQYLIKIGIVSIQNQNPITKDSSQTKTSDNFLKELEACKEITKAYDRIKCEDAVNHKIMIKEYKDNSQVYVTGPITFYFPGADLEIMSSGQANLSIRLLAENTGSTNEVTLMCTGPAVCNYDVWDGHKAFKYSATDFTSGQTVVKPGESKEINMVFGPNIGYGGTKFEYEPSKDYYFRVSEPWGSTNIPLNLQ